RTRGERIHQARARRCEDDHREAPGDLCGGLILLKDLLERADAKTIIEKLQEIFEKNQPSTGAPVAEGNAARVVRPVNVNITPEGTPLPPGATVTETGTNSIEISAGTLSEDGIIVGKIKLAADERTNRIHVITRPRNMEFIRELLREFDKDVPFGEPATR